MPKTVDKVIEPAADALMTEQSLQDVTKNLNRLMHAGLYGVESPIERAMELIGDKYSFQIIHILYQFDTQRFVELEQQITGISPRTLSARLKHLEKFRLIDRHQYPTIPPKVEYKLTERGRDLATTLESLEQWVNRWFPYQPTGV
ncbi:MAG TPA: helix-turn-helix domain-containing protein [Coleofasciculaceae cyanobacterium]